MSKKGFWYTQKPSPMTRLRYWAITTLAGGMPVVLNMRVSRPPGYEGPLVEFPDPKPGMFCKNYLDSEPKSCGAILTPYEGQTAGVVH